MDIPSAAKRHGPDNGTPAAKTEPSPVAAATAAAPGSSLTETGTPKLSNFPKADKTYRNMAEEPGKDTSGNTIYGINFIQNGIAIALNGFNDDNLKFFKLTGPQRLVVEVFGVKNSLERNLIPVNRFGIKRVRIGTYPYKVRLVFDASNNVFPACRIMTDNHGIQVLFNK